MMDGLQPVVTEVLKLMQENLVIRLTHDQQHRSSRKFTVAMGIRLRHDRDDSFLSG